jgi:hypothetical protein
MNALRRCYQRPEDYRQVLELFYNTVVDKFFTDERIEAPQGVDEHTMLFVYLPPLNIDEAVTDANTSYRNQNNTYWQYLSNDRLYSDLNTFSQDTGEDRADSIAAQRIQQ